MKSKHNSITIVSLSFFVISLFLFTALPVSAQGNKAADIVAKTVAALGGEKAIKAFEHFEAEGSVKVTFGTREMAGTIRVVQQGPKLYKRVKMTFGSREFLIIQSYDGKVNWRDMMGTISDEPTLNNESDLDHTMNLLIRKGAVYSLGKETEIDGKKAVGVVAEYKGKKTTFFIDKQNFMVLEIVFKDLYFGRKAVKELIGKRIRYKDFKKKDGFLFPFTTLFYQKGKKKLELMFSTINFNPKVQASLFQRPDKAPDLRFRAERYE